MYCTNMRVCMRAYVRVYGSLRGPAKSSLHCFSKLDPCTDTDKYRCQKKKPVTDVACILTYFGDI